MHPALAQAAAERVEEALPTQDHLYELLGMPDDAVGLIKRAVGRPPGAHNRRLEELSRLARARFGDVLLQQVAVATMPIAHLIALGLEPLQAVAEKRLAAAVVLPYLEQRQPLRVDVTGRQPIYLTLEMAGGASHALDVDGAVMPIDAPPVPSLDHAQHGTGARGRDEGARGGGAVFGQSPDLGAPPPEQTHEDPIFFDATGGFIR